MLLEITQNTLVSLTQMFIFSVCTSIVSSFIFLFLVLFIMRPSVYISDYICYYEMDDDGKKKYWYVFKIVNKSRLFSTFNITINIDKILPVVTNNGDKINHKIVPIETSSKYIEHLPKRKREKNYGDNAYLIRTECDIKSIIEQPNTKVILTVSSKHQLTNLTRVRIKEFLNSEVIKKDKEFKFGTSLNHL